MAFLDFGYRTVALYNFCKFLKYAQFIIFTLYLQILYPSRTCISFFCLSNIYREIPSIQGDVNLKEQGPCFQETLNEKKAAAGNTTRVILKLCLIKYELDINFYDFENWLFFNCGFSTKVDLHVVMTCAFLLKENI